MSIFMNKHDRWMAEQNAARAAARKAGIPDSTPALTWHQQTKPGKRLDWLLLSDNDRNDLIDLANEHGGEPNDYRDQLAERKRQSEAYNAAAYAAQRAKHAGAQAPDPPTNWSRIAVDCAAATAAVLLLVTPMPYLAFFPACWIANMLWRAIR
jgi:hypothetical protein